MLSFKSLTVGYDRPILKNISGDLKSGAITFLIGPNGSGKTTLLKALSNVLPPIDGILSTSDRPVYFPSNINLQNGLTGNDLLELYSSPNSKWSNHSLLDFLEVKNLMESPLERLSSGERQRIFLGAILSNESSIVLLDEPLNHLDWNFSLKLKKILIEQTHAGRCFLISNHDLNWALGFSDTQTWVLFKESIFLNNSTESVLNDIKLQQVFRIKTEVINTQNDKKIISLSEL
jgi:ABC-type cobalamin/Fe3+-siderophores transport system ATPase subunit